MANYTMTIYEMMNNPLTPIFPDNYPFYCDDEEIKKEFEETFILRYLSNEIGFESPYLFNQKLLGKLKLIMPYYEQLYQTEWYKVKSVEQMMTSKDLIETTTHEQTITGETSSQLNGSNEMNQTSSSNVSQTASSTNSGTSSQDSKQSNLADGVSSASLTDGFLTSVAENNTTDSQQSEQTASQESSSSEQGTNSVNQTTKGNNDQTLNESTTFTSKGDIGVQTPAYAIAEWRKVIININKMIIDECSDLFMKIY